MNKLNLGRVKGDQGPQGYRGPQGDTGPQGIQGTQGPKGDAGPQGPRGYQGVKGDTGPQGIKGDTGPQGPQGDQGDVGPQGPPVNIDIIPQAEAEAGESTEPRTFTAQRVRQAIVAWFNGVSGAIGRTILSRTTAAQVRADIGLDAVDNTADADKPVSTAVTAALTNKVDKVAGKQLSDENYTSPEKAKLAGVAVGATKNRADSENADKVHTHTAGQVTGLGTAATKDVGVSTGNVMQVGSFGLGSFFGLNTYRQLTGDSLDIDKDFEQKTKLTETTSFVRTESASVQNGKNIPSFTPGLHISCASLWGRFYFSEDGLFIFQSGRWGSKKNTEYVHHTGNLLQTTGSSTDYPMSQKAVTDALAATAPVVVAANATVTLTNGRAVYAVNTTSAARTLTLPANPPAGATVTIVDYANTCGINALTIARNGRNIEGAAANAALTQNGQRVEMVYIDATQGWKVISSYRHGGFI